MMLKGGIKMKFDGNKVAFGRHETFALRYSWLSKGFSALKNNPLVFDSEDSVVELGVGRNMVNSIRYWLRASQVITPQKPDEPTELGQLLFDEKEGFDPYLEDEATIWLIHWLIATNSELATSWYWFFNNFHKPEFSAQELHTALSDFVKDLVVDNKRPSTSTLKNDAQLLPRMYVQSKISNRTPLEDSLDSPLSLLGLITQSSSGKLFQSKPQARPNLPIGIFGFAVAQLMDELQHTAIPLEELMYSGQDQAAPGSVFRLTESDMIAKLEKLEAYLPEKFEIRETAGIHQLYRIDTVEPIEYLKKHYGEMSKELAA